MVIAVRDQPVIGASLSKPHPTLGGSWCKCYECCMYKWTDHSSFTCIASITCIDSEWKVPISNMDLIRSHATMRNIFNSSRSCSHFNNMHVWNVEMYPNLDSAVVINFKDISWLLQRLWFYTYAGMALISYITYMHIQNYTCNHNQAHPTVY